MRVAVSPPLASLIIRLAWLPLLVGQHQAFVEVLAPQDGSVFVWESGTAVDVHIKVRSVVVPADCNADLYLDGQPLGSLPQNEVRYQLDKTLGFGKHLLEVILVDAQDDRPMGVEGRSAFTLSPPVGTIWAHAPEPPISASTSAGDHGAEVVRREGHRPREGQHSDAAPRQAEDACGLSNGKCEATAHVEQPDDADQPHRRAQPFSSAPPIPGGRGFEALTPAEELQRAIEAAEQRAQSFRQALRSLSSLRCLAPSPSPSPATCSAILSSHHAHTYATCPCARGTGRTFQSQR